MMERGPPASRLQAPSMAAKRGPGGGGGAATGAGTAPFGLRRPAPSTNAAPATRRGSPPHGAETHVSPPQLALHELHHGAPPPTTTTPTTFLRRGSGRTIATLAGNHAAMTPPPPPASATRRRSGGQSPRATAPTANGTQRPTSTNGTPLRSRHGSRDAGPSGDILSGNKVSATNKKASPPKTARERVPLTSLSPETSLRQRKRSADVMDPLDPAFRALQALVHESAPAEEVNEPPMQTANGGVENQLVASGPMTPPPRTSNAHEVVGADGMLPLSPRDPKRQKRLTRSPKTPLGLSTYESEEGGLSATQRVRLSLSGYMSIASLTGVGGGPSSARSARRESGAGGGSGALDSGMLVSNGDAQASAPSPVDGHTTMARSALRSSPSRLDQSTSSLARSKFAASRSMSGPQMASALLPTKNAVDCLMGYIRELQRSEALLRVQLEKIRKQRHEELSRSTVHVTTLEKTLTEVESERERERRELEEQQHMIQALKSEVAELHHAMTSQPPASYSRNDTQQQLPLHPDQAQWGERDGTSVYNDYPDESLPNSLPASAYVTPPPSNSGGRQFSRSQQQSSDGVGDSYGQAADASAPVNGHDTSPAEWTEEQIAYYQSQGYYQDAQDPTSMPSVGTWSDQTTGYYGGQEHFQQYQQDPSSMPTEDTVTPPGEWTEQPAQYNKGGQDYYDHHATYAAVEPPAVPMSPVAKLNASWSLQDAKKGVQPQIEVPPPMFRVHPRLSDIISPLSRSVIAAPVTTDHNVLTPVTPQALSNARQQPRVSEAAQTAAADQAFMMTPPAPLGPPAFSMSGFHSGSKRNSTPPPSSKPKGQNGNVPNGHTHPVPDHVPGQEEQFVPAEQVFKLFHKPKTPKHKASTTPSKGGVRLSKEALKVSLVEFFTTVDKTKLRMVEGYSRRYQGEEAKLLADLTKKYGAQKVAELKRTFENASKPSAAVENDFPPQEPEPAAIRAPPTPRGLAPSPVYAAPASATEANPGLTVESVETWTTAPTRPTVGTEFAGQSVDATPEQPLHMPPPTAFDEYDTTSTAPLLTSRATTEIAGPQPLAPPPPSQKVSPNSARRGPPLPFSFDEVFQEEMAPAMLPPPQVSVTAPPTLMAPPPLAPQSPTTKAASSPPRRAPSPPRAPPPSERSPARNASVLRQRVSPQRPPPPPPTNVMALPPHGPPAIQPPRVLSMSSSTPSTPKLNAALPVTLEGLLLEFYRKHQPDHVKNVPELVKMYTGKERELVSLLKKKYGALSIKRLEQNLAVLEQQSSTAATAGAKTVGNLSSNSTTAAKKSKARGCFGRFVVLLLKLILIRVAVTLVLLGGLVALDHSQCQQDPALHEGVITGVEECQSLSQEVASFQISHLTEYVQRVESRACFCEQWRRREATMFDEPSVGHALELVKLVPFSRTVAEPAWLHFVDQYLPDVPYSEYYGSYAKPAFVTGKEYALVGVEHAKQAYTEVVTRMPEMPWPKVYESHGKPAIEVTGEYAALAFKHLRDAYQMVAVAAVDQWTLLVEMYNEEGTAASLSVDVPPTDGSKVVDALTNAAKASKALAEPHDTNEDEDASSVSTAAYEVPSSDEVASDVTDGVDGSHEETDAKHSDSDAAPVEVVIEQAGLDLSYSDLNADAEGSDGDAQGTTTPGAEEPFDNVKPALDVDNAVAVDETFMVEDAARSNSEVEANEEEEYEVTATVESTDEPAAVMAEPSVETKPVRGGDDESVTSAERSIQDDVVVREEVPVAIEQSVEVDLAILEVHVKQHSADDNDLAAGQAPTRDDSPIESVPLADDGGTTMIDHAAVVSLDANAAIDAIPLVKIAASEMEEADADRLADATVVLTSMDTAGMITETDPVVLADTIEVAETKADVIPLNKQPADHQEGSVGHQAASEDGSSTATVSDEEAQGDDADEDLSFLEDMGGLDPLELLDLADMAAAELHSIN